jgi:hypothetical protein
MRGVSPSIIDIAQQKQHYNPLRIHIMSNSPIFFQLRFLFMTTFTNQSFCKALKLSVSKSMFIHVLFFVSFSFLVHYLLFIILVLCKRGNLMQILFWLGLYLKMTYLFLLDWHMHIIIHFNICSNWPAVGKRNLSVAAL